MKHYAFIIAGLTAGILSFVSQSVLAESKTNLFSQEYAHCLKKAAGAISPLNACIDAEVKRHDEKLNKAYKVLMSSLPNRRKQQLKDVQRLWLKYRDANCKLYLDPDGGHQAGINAHHCLLTMTAQRANELERFFQKGH